MKRRDSVLAVLAVLATLAAARYAHELVKLVVETERIDFGTFYTFTADLWRGHDPFQSVGQPGGAPLGLARAETPPTFAPGGYLLFLPLVGLPYAVARAVWLLVGQAALGLSLWALWRRLAPPPYLALAGLAIALGYQPIYEDVAVGNLNLIVLVLLALASVSDPRVRPGAVALPLSVALTLKLYCVALLPLLALAGAPLAAAVAATLALGWSALGLVVFGAGWLPAYVHFLTLGTEPLHAWGRNLSPHAVLHRVLDARPSGLVEALAILSASVVAVLAVRAARAARGGDADTMLVAWAAAVAALPLMSPLTEEHHLAVTLLPLLVAIWRLPALTRPVDIAGVAAATALLAPRYSLESFPLFGRGVWAFATAAKAAGAAALLVLLAHATPKAGAHV